MIFSGAGLSAESGISTFRDSDGLWENYDVMEVCSTQGWRQKRRRDPIPPTSLWQNWKENIPAGCGT